MSRKPVTEIERRVFVATADMFDDLPDGAFMAAMEEFGYDTEALVRFSNDDKRRKKARKSQSPTTGERA